MQHKIGHWSITEDFNPNDYLGFIYCITNTQNGMQYVGRKQFRNKVRVPPRKGKIRKRTVFKETNWETYTGSCTTLNLVMEVLGKELFTFEIIQLCTSKSEMQYWESYNIITSGALLTGYNSQVPRVSCKPQPKK